LERPGRDGDYTSYQETFPGDEERDSLWIATQANSRPFRGDKGASENENSHPGLEITGTEQTADLSESPEFSP
jgi:hypothetical protein